MLSAFRTAKNYRIVIFERCKQRLLKGQRPRTDASNQPFLASFDRFRTGPSTGSGQALRQASVYPSPAALCASTSPTRGEVKINPHRRAMHVDLSSHSPSPLGEVNK